MKTLLYFIAIALLITGCNNNSAENEDELLKDEHAVTDTINVPQPSDFSFDEALAALNEKKFNQATVLIKGTIAGLKREKENMNIPGVKQKMEATIGKIELTADSLASGKEINIKKLEQYYSDAELLLARQYYVLIEMPEAVDKTYVAMDKTIGLMESGISHGSKDLKNDAGEIVRQTKNLLQKSANNKPDNKEELKNHSGKIKAFLEKHT